MDSGGRQRNITFSSQKFEDAVYREKIRNATSAKEAANLGRSRELPLRKDWEQVKDEVMYRAVSAEIPDSQRYPGVVAFNW